MAAARTQRPPSCSSPSVRRRRGHVPRRGRRRPGSRPARRRCSPARAAPRMHCRPRRSSGRCRRPRCERDQDKVGIDHRSERAHLARGADPRLDDREAVTGRIQAAERERDTDVVVEVALSRKHAASLPPEQEREELLRRRLARAAGDPDEGPAKGLPLLAGDRLQGCKGVGHHELRQCDAGNLPGYDGRGRAGPLRVAQEIVAVAPCGLERNERLARRGPARVHREPDGRRGGAARPASPGPQGKDVWIEGRHQFLRAFTPISSRTTCRSSKGITVSANSW